MLMQEMSEAEKNISRKAVDDLAFRKSISEYFIPYFCNYQIDAAFKLLNSVYIF